MNNEENNPRQPPPNPHYEREWKSSTRVGHARLTISAPGGRIDPDDATDIIEWLEIVMRQLKRITALE